MPLSPNKLLPLIRLGVLGSVSLFSFIILALSAHTLEWSNRVLSSYYDFAALALAISILSLLTLPAMLFIGRTRSKAVSSFIGVELGWTGLLWVLWLASAGTTASANKSGGRCYSRNPGWTTFCRETNAFEAFAFINWLILMPYFVVLLWFSIKAFQSGNEQIWTSSVNEANFEGGPNTGHSHKYPVEHAGPAPQYSA